jgi:hypothetical protein
MDGQAVATAVNGALHAKGIARPASNASSMECARSASRIAVMTGPAGGAGQLLPAKHFATGTT